MHRGDTSRWRQWAHGCLQMHRASVCSLWKFTQYSALRMLLAQRAEDALGRERQLGAADAEGVLERVGDRGSDGHAASLPDPLRPERPVRRWNLHEVDGHV